MDPDWVAWVAVEAGSEVSGEASLFIFTLQGPSLKRKVQRSPKKSNKTKNGKPPAKKAKFNSMDFLLQWLLMNLMKNMIEMKINYIEIHL